MTCVITHRITGDELFAADCDLMRNCVEVAVRVGANLTDANLARAYLINANMTGANLTDTNLTGANLTDANLARANLADANLTGANLTGANLSGAYLSGANLACAVGVIALGTPDGWHAHAWLRNGWLSIRVGCREMRLQEARKYWTGKTNRREVMAALDYAQAVAVIRGWPITQPATEAA